MTVKAFCDKYDLKFQTVYKKIAHYENTELAGHVIRSKGKSLELDDFAVDFLLPIHVKVLQAVDECEGIARENDELKEKLCSVETITEQTEIQLSKALDENGELVAEIDSLKTNLSEKDKEIAALTNEFEQQHRTSEQAINELEKRIAELTEKKRLFTEKLEAVPKIFRKNQ